MKTDLSTNLVGADYVLVASSAINELKEAINELKALLGKEQKTENRKGENMPKEQYHSRKEVAKYLNISPQTVSNWINDKTLNGKKIGGKIYITETELQRYINRNDT